MSNNKINKVIDLYTELIMEQGDDTLKTIINGRDFKAKLLTATGQKKLKKPKDPNSPKKPTTAWLLFCQDTRPKLKEGNTSLKMSEITSLMSPMWAKLQESNDPDDVTTVADYNKIVEAQRSVYKTAKDKVTAAKPKKAPRNAWALFMRNERAKPRPLGETVGDTTSRISAAWAQLKDDDPKKIEELTAEVKRLRAEADDSSASECEDASDTEVTKTSECEDASTTEVVSDTQVTKTSECEDASTTEVVSDTQVTKTSEVVEEEEQVMSIESILQKMHEEEDDVGVSEDATSKAADITSEPVQEKPKSRGKLKTGGDEPKQKRPRCKKKAQADT